MKPAVDYGELIVNLTDRFRTRYEVGLSSRVRMVGIVFAPYNSPLSKAEIIPQLNDWHYRCGDHMDFYFGGYMDFRPPTPEYEEVSIPGHGPWLYSAKRFHAFRQELEVHTSWRYGGECELLLTNARFDVASRSAFLDFRSTICCQLDTMKNDQAIRSVGRFFESVFRFAESATGDDPAWGYSDSQGKALAGSALKRVVLDLLPRGLHADYTKAEHFVVRDVAPR